MSNPILQNNGQQSSRRSTHLIGRRRTLRCTGLRILTLAVAVFTGKPAYALEPQRLWVYAPVNFQVDRNTDELLTLLRRAKAADYNGAVVTDYKFGKIEGRPQHYYSNLRRTRQAAESIGIELIPCVMPIGYSNSILQNNPNLAAGLPVKQCRFLVRGGRAGVADSGNLLPGGGFETAERNRPAGWDWIDGFGTSTTLDRQEKHSGAASVVMRNFRKGNEAGNCRVVKNLKLEPYHQYQFTVWVKTEGLECSEFKVAPLVGGRTLSYANLGVKPTQDWTRHRVVFNSLEHEDVRLYLGLWNGRSGTVWLDDARLEMVGGVNLLRREGCPIRVVSEDGSVEFHEGRDFTRWSDPQLGQVPYAGEFSDDHEATPIVLTGDSRIRDGQILRVSFYHTVIIYDGQVGCSLVAPELFEHLGRQVQALHEHWQPARWFMQHDEIRVAGHDQLAGGRTSGQLLAENVRRCTDLIRKANPKAEVLVWSDMFDPQHNARDDYYLVHGTLAGAWQGLDRSVTIVNWNRGHAAKSLAWFAGRGHRQIIAGYYDGNVAGNMAHWRKAANGVSGVDGTMYTTWRKEYKDLEAFAKLAGSDP